VCGIKMNTANVYDLLLNKLILLVFFCQILILLLKV
jgi:hypothetical protein